MGMTSLLQSCPGSAVRAKGGSRRNQSFSSRISGGLCPARGVGGVLYAAISVPLLQSKLQVVSHEERCCCFRLADCDKRPTAPGAHPVRGKGRAHPVVFPIEGYEPSFSLIRAPSRHAMQGDSYVSQSAICAPASAAAKP